MNRIAISVFAFLFLAAVSHAKVQDAEFFTVLDENVDEVLAWATGGGGTGEKISDAYAGDEALYVASTGGDGQIFNPTVPDWSFSIVENPAGLNEFRYITFAWKKDGGNGIQLQIHGDPDTWGHRYHAGDNVKGWNPSIQVSTSIPTDWTLETRDLFGDWGEFTVTGMAFTAWDGNGGAWDFVYFHKSPTPPTAVEPAGKLATTWAGLKTTR